MASSQEHQTRAGGNGAELRRILENFIGMGLIAIPQEIIPGKDSDVFSLSAYIDRFGRCVGYRTKRKLRQWPLDAGNGCAQEICIQPEVAELDCEFSK